MMKNFCMGLIIGAVLFGCALRLPAVDFDAKYNERKINTISTFIKNQIKSQRAAYNRQYFGEKKEGESGANPNPGGGEGGQAKIPPFVVDVNALRKAVAASFPAKKDDPGVDQRSVLELEEEAERQVGSTFPEVSEDEFLEMEKEAAEKEYPLYKEGEVVEISFARGNEPKQVYKGRYRRISKYKLTIGKKQMLFQDLPEFLRARFDKDLNREKRQEMLDRHVLTNKKKIEREEAIFKRRKEMLDQQWRQNLPRGWVMANEAWIMPVEFVDYYVK